MAADNYRFAESDSLLCYHGPMLYEAKCLKRKKTNDGKAQYFIHYKGWNSKWEEWVDDNRVLAVNTANMNKMASLKEIHSNTKKSGSKRSITIVKEESIRNVVTPPIKGKKRKYSEISSGLNQIVNVPSPTESKPKKRGRPPKLITPKIEETEAIKSVDTTLKTETAIKTESTESTEEKRVINKAIKEEDTAIIEDNAKKLYTVKKEVTLKKDDTSKKEDILKQEETLNKDVTPKKEDTPKKKNTSKKTGVIKTTNEATEEIVTTKEVFATETVEAIKDIEANKIIEEIKEEEGITKTVDEEIKALKVEIVTEELEETIAVKPCVEPKDIEGTETIKEVDESETVIKTDNIEETETENIEGFESIEEYDAEEFEAEEVDAYDEIEEFEETDGDEEIETDDESEDEETKEFFRKFNEICMRLRKNKETEGTDGTFTVPAPVIKKIPVIKVPEIIRRRIALDNFMVVHRNKVIKFPKKLTIQQLIDDYDNSQSNIEVSENIGLTFIQYFDILVHHRLLYPPEKKINMRKKAFKCLKANLRKGEVFECNDLLYPRKFWHLVYGPTHLLRLFVLLPEIVQSFTYLEEDVLNLIGKFEHFMKFIEMNFDQYFSNIIYSDDL